MTGPQGLPGANGVTQTWSGIYYPIAHPPGATGRIARFTVNAPEAGYITLMAHFTVGIDTKADMGAPSDCAVTTELSTASDGSVSGTNGTSVTYIPADMKTQVNAAAYLGIPQSISRTFAVTPGSVTFYLNGRINTGCFDAVWYSMNFTAFFSKSHTPATVTPL